MSNPSAFLDRQDRGLLRALFRFDTNMDNKKKTDAFEHQKYNLAILEQFIRNKIPTVFYQKLADEIKERGPKIPPNILREWHLEIPDPELNLKSDSFDFDNANLTLTDLNNLFDVNKAKKYIKEHVEFKIQEYPEMQLIYAEDYDNELAARKNSSTPRSRGFSSLVRSVSGMLPSPRRLSSPRRLPAPRRSSRGGSTAGGKISKKYKSKKVRKTKKRKLHKGRFPHKKSRNKRR